MTIAIIIAEYIKDFENIVWLILEQALFSKNHIAIKHSRSVIDIMMISIALKVIMYRLSRKIMICQWNEAINSASTNARALKYNTIDLLCKVAIQIKLSIEKKAHNIPKTQKNIGSS
ncbi:MAG: hypothetical protein Q3961_00840 [Bifidobacteriaceae bacterium]|nr:hypothetical protein [Bifidobacteriaceae bacterium]